MSSSNSNNRSSGLGLGSVLTIVFIVLKVTKVIDWSWWWVLSPLWISFLLRLFIIGIYILIDIFSEKSCYRRYRRHERSDRLKW